MTGPSPLNLTSTDQSGVMPTAAHPYDQGSQRDTENIAQSVPR